MVICHCENDNCLNKTCNVDGYCFSASLKVFDKNKFTKIKKFSGCLFNTESGQLHCKTKNSRFINYFCCKEDFCNSKFNETINLPIKNFELNKKSVNFLYITLIVTLILVIILFILSYFICYILRKKPKKKYNSLPLNNPNSFLTINNQIIQNKKKGVLYEELKIIKVLKEKNNDELAYHAKRNDINVYIKIFKLNDQKLWLNEIDIYKLTLIRHENILNFIAKSEYTIDNKVKNYFILTEYHPIGNLHNFLKSKPDLNKDELLKLMKSAASGLNHLHLEISNNQRKPSIVHRNINTKNFIIKWDKTCALANFEYAIKANDLFKRNDEVKNEIPICLLNYCPPEYLSNLINMKSIVSLKSADVYSFGCVLWQISNYFFNNNYKMPFEDELKKIKFLDENLSEDEKVLQSMKHLLLNENKKLSSFLNLTDTLNTFQNEIDNIISESCYFEPLSRLSIRKIEFILKELISK